MNVLICTVNVSFSNNRLRKVRYYDLRNWYNNLHSRTLGSHINIVALNKYNETSTISNSMPGKCGSNNLGGAESYFSYITPKDTELQKDLTKEKLILY